MNPIWIITGVRAQVPAVGHAVAAAPTGDVFFAAHDFAGPEVVDVGANLDHFADEGSRMQTYEFPSRGACLECHNGAARVLGLSTAQINRNFDYDGITDNQLRSFDHIGLFSTSIGASSGYARLSDPADTTASLAARARSYLDGNCSQCHQPAGFANTNLDLRASTPIAQTATRDVPPQKGDLGLTDARVIAPGAKERSVLWERMRRLDGARMPPLATSVVDQDAVVLIGEWIDAGAN